MKSTHIQASVVVPNFDARYPKVKAALRVPDDEVELDGRVERTRPHVTLFGGLLIQKEVKSENVRLETLHNRQTQELYT